MSLGEHFCNIAIRYEIIQQKKFWNIKTIFANFLSLFTKDYTESSLSVYETCTLHKFKFLQICYDSFQMNKKGHTEAQWSKDYFAKDIRRISSRKKKSTLAVAFSGLQIKSDKTGTIAHAQLLNGCSFSIIHESLAEKCCDKICKPCVICIYFWPFVLKKLKKFTVEIGRQQ